MFKKLGLLAVSVFLLASISGCFLLLAGTAGGAGTAVWLSGKLSQEVNASFDKTIQASRSALASLSLSVTKETVEQDLAQIKSEYKDGKTIWIDVHRVSDNISRVEVRVGAVQGDKTAAQRILNAIKNHL